MSSSGALICLGFELRLYIRKGLPKSWRYTKRYTQQARRYWGAFLLFKRVEDIYFHGATMVGRPRSSASLRAKS